MERCKIAINMCILYIILYKFLSASESYGRLDFAFTNTQILSLNDRMSGICEILHPSLRPELRSLLGGVNRLSKFIPQLGSFCFPFRNIFKKDTS